MHITCVQALTPVVTPHGEVIHEYMGAAAGGSVAHSLAHITLPPGTAARKHYHPAAEESYFILSGKGLVTVGEEMQQISAGDAIAIPAMSVHQIANNGHDPLIFLAVCVPPWTPDCSVFLDET